MNYLALIKNLQRRKYFLFSLKDLAVLFPDAGKKTLQNQLTAWTGKGYIRHLKQDLYELVDKGIPDQVIPDLYIANRLYSPSYVSLETALSIYNIIPEVAFGVTSVTTKPTRVFKNQYGQFRYSTCQPKAYTGYVIKEYSGYKVFIAEPEKAIIDFLYFRFRGNNLPDFAAERMNIELLKELDWRIISKYCGLYNKRMRKHVRMLKEYAGC